MKKRWLEPTLLITLFGLIYFIPIQRSVLPVFSGQFNNLDGSLHAVRLFDLIISVSLFFYASRYLIPRQVDWLSITKIIFGFIATILLASLFEWGWDALTLRVFNLPTAAGEISDKMLFNPRHETLSLTILWGNTMVIASGVFYGLVRDRTQHLRHHEQLERENLEAEVKYLRSQINPHFLFNTLNNIFAITQRNDDAEGSDALLMLSGLMRYMLYESSGQRIDLQAEIEHLRNYMKLMSLKYKSDDSPKVDILIEGSTEKCQIAPLILLPFVENAFKHGVNSQGQGFIKIRLRASAEEVYFSVRNSRFPDHTASSEHKGIGLENVKKRLDHLYKNHHHLEISSSDEEYRIALRITL